MRVVVSGVPRGYQEPRPDGNWLQEEHRRRIEALSPDIELVEMPQGEVHEVGEGVEGVEVLLAEGGNRFHYGEELDWEDMGWKVVRYWEEELKDWRNIGERLSEEIWDRAEELGIIKE